MQGTSLAREDTSGIACRLTPEIAGAGFAIKADGVVRLSEAGGQGSGTSHTEAGRLSCESLFLDAISCRLKRVVVPRDTSPRAMSPALRQKGMGKHGACVRRQYDTKMANQLVTEIVRARVEAALAAADSIARVGHSLVKGRLRRWCSRRLRVSACHDDTAELKSAIDAAKQRACAAAFPRPPRNTMRSRSSPGGSQCARATRRVAVQEVGAWQRFGVSEATRLVGRDVGVTRRFVQNCTLSGQGLEHRTNLA